MLPFRIMPIVYLAAALAGGTALYWLADKIGDIREAQVRDRIERAIQVTNGETQSANESDEETLALAAKMRLAALAAALKLPRKTQCELTADEATTLGRIQ